MIKITFLGCTDQLSVTFFYFLGRCCIPKRYVFVLLGFLGFFNIFATRVCLSVSMVAMVNSSIVTHINNIQVVSECPDLIHRNESVTDETKVSFLNFFKKIFNNAEITEIIHSLNIYVHKLRINGNFNFETLLNPYLPY